MSDYVLISESEEFDSVSIQFDNEADTPFALGGAMNEANEEAYMNGYNWDAFFNAYLAVYAPELLEGLESDPEAGSYFARYPLTDENRRKAENFKELIIDLVENKEQTLAFLRSHGSEIEWD